MKASSVPRLAAYTPGAPPMVCIATQIHLFTDLHLDPERPEECARFGASLTALRAQARGKALIVMGDLFDAYAGPEDWALPPFARLHVELSALAAAGMRVILLRGNRDVLLEASSPLTETRLEVQDAVLCQLPGRLPALVTHGDAFCLADRRYQFLRRSLRRPGLRRFLLGRSIGFRRWLAARLRGVSRGEVARKPLEALDVHPDPILQELHAHVASQLVIGHLHVQRSQRLPGERILRILPAWDPAAPAWDLASVLDGGI